MAQQLDVNKMFNEIRETYASDPRNKTFNSLVYGHPGTGKTFSLRTARKPVLIHSFDPGGTESVSDEINKGTILADTRFEGDMHPSTFRRWEQEFNRLQKNGVFEHVGTYVLDSITSWCDVLLAEIMRREGVNDIVPRLRDYMIQIKTAADYMKEMTILPCDFIAIGHIDVQKDEVSGRTITTLMTTGKLKTKLPLLFDEVYVADTKQKSDGIKYFFLTQNDGRYKARSRMAKEGNGIKPNMPQDYKNILSEAGYDTSDKPLHISED